MDPLTVAVVTASAHATIRMINARAGARMLRAHTELVLAIADLPPGTEISSTGRDGATSTIRVPAARPSTAMSGGRDD